MKCPRLELMLFIVLIGQQWSYWEIFHNSQRVLTQVLQRLMCPGLPYIVQRCFKQGFTTLLPWWFLEKDSLNLITKFPPFLYLLGAVYQGCQLCTIRRTDSFFRKDYAQQVPDCVDTGWNCMRCYPLGPLNNLVAYRLSGGSQPNSLFSTCQE